jgi:hypothetical protein
VRAGSHLLPEIWPSIVWVDSGSALVLFLEEQTVARLSCRLNSIRIPSRFNNESLLIQTGFDALSLGSPLSVLLAEYSILNPNLLPV